MNLYECSFDQLVLNYKVSIYYRENQPFENGNAVHRLILCCHIILFYLENITSLNIVKKFKKKIIMAKKHTQKTHQICLETQCHVYALYRHRHKDHYVNIM